MVNLWSPCESCNTNPTKDENRTKVTNDNYTLAVIRHFLNPGLTHVVIPVIYNTCVDFGEASIYISSVWGY